MGGADAGGVAMVVYNYMRYIDQNKYHFDIALTGHQPGMLGKKMICLGARFYLLPLKSKGVSAFENALKCLLEKEHFDVVHVHENSTSYVALRIAKRCGISCRIAHAHTAGKPNSFKNWLIIQSGHFLNSYYATNLIGCGQKAGELVFGISAMKNEKAYVLPNSIDPEIFRFNPVTREQVRQELNIGNRYTIGMVGRLAFEKNHSFILPVIKKLHEQLSEIVFVLVGRGDQEEKLKKYCKDNCMNEYVLFCGVRSDVERIYQGFDVCVIPSLYEGFPVVGLEAIAAGLPVLLSNQITTELECFNSVKYLPLEEKKWINALSKMPMNTNRYRGVYEIKEHHFDVKDTVNILQRIYNTSGKLELNNFQ